MEQSFQLRYTASDRNSKMQRKTSLLMLLVCLTLSFAHDSNKRGWKSFDSIETRESVATKNETAVENWSLLCKVLCRNGFGGPRCDPFCKVGPKDRLEINDTISTSICPELCEVDLGGKNCHCSISSKRLLADKICLLLCKHHRLQLAGCSSCKTMNSSVETTTFDETSAATEITESTETSETTPSEDEIEASTDSQETKTSNEIGSSSLSTLNDYSTKSETKPSTAAEVTSTPTIKSTPNWTELCEKLCRQGDGGALCNCDIPPFMLND